MVKIYASDPSRAFLLEWAEMLFQLDRVDGYCLINELPSTFQVAQFGFCGFREILET